MPSTPIYPKCGPLHDEQELREQISNVISNDPAILNSIIDPIALLIADKIINSSAGQLIGKLACKLVNNKVFIDSLSSNIHDTVAQELYEATCIDLEDQNKEIAVLNRKYQDLSVLNEQLNTNLDDLEQYSRRNCLLLHGIRESPNEIAENVILETINNKLKLTLKPDDIDRTHRIGQLKRKPDASNTMPKPRPFIIKFVSYRARFLVFRNKRLLKGSGLLVTENLTRQRNEILQDAKHRSSVESAWSQDGRIVLLLKTKKKVTITTLSELNKVTS